MLDNCSAEGRRQAVVLPLGLDPLVRGIGACRYIQHADALVLLQALGLPLSILVGWVGGIVSHGWSDSCHGGERSMSMCDSLYTFHRLRYREYRRGKVAGTAPVEARYGISTR